MTVMRSRELQPDTFYVRLKLVDVINPSPGTVSYDFLVVGNDLLDPLGLAIQPAGFDQYKALYNNYQVLGSSLTVTAQTFTNITGFYIGTYPSRTTSVIPLRDMMGLPYAKYKTGASTLGGPGVVTVSNYMRTKKFIGRSVDDVDYTAAITGTPTRVWYWHVHALNADNTTNIVMSWILKMNFYVKFWNRKVVVDA